MAGIFQMQSRVAFMPLLTPHPSGPWDLSPGPISTKSLSFPPFPWPLPFLRLPLLLSSLLTALRALLQYRSELAASLFHTLLCPATPTPPTRYSPAPSLVTCGLPGPGGCALLGGGGALLWHWADASGPSPWLSLFFPSHLCRCTSEPVHIRHPHLCGCWGPAKGISLYLLPLTMCYPSPHH